MLSNAPTPLPDAGVADGTAVWEFPAGPVISSYIAAIIAGPYAVWRDVAELPDGRSIPLGLFTRASLAQYADPDVMFDTVRAGLDYYERSYGVEYPYDKYDQIFVPEYNWGAMENVGAVTFNESYLFRSKVSEHRRQQRTVVILHELSHMWFGNSVTMKWWNDLWLNESFATWTSTIATASVTEFTDAWATFTSVEKTRAAMAGPAAVDASDRRHHQRSARRRGQLRRDHLRQGRLGAQAARGLGRPRRVPCRNRHVPAQARRRQRDTARPARRARGLERPRAHRLVEALARDRRRQHAASRVRDRCRRSVHRVRHRPDRRTTSTRRCARTASPSGSTTSTPTEPSCARTGSRSTSTAPAPRCPSFVGVSRGALVLLNDDDLSYAKIRLDEDSLATAVDHLCDLQDPVARALIWGAVWDTTRDGETPAGDFVRLVLGNISHEDQSSARGTALSQLELALERYIEPAAAEQVAADCGDALWALTVLADAESDAQLQFVTSFIRIASTAPHFDILASLLDGSVALEGLSIDTDLRWELVIALAAGGAATDADIDHALASDDTAKGRQFAATARAARPDAEGKLAAWTRVATDASLSNDMARAIATGWGRSRPAALLEHEHRAVLRDAPASVVGAQLHDGRAHRRAAVPVGPRHARARRRRPRLARRERRSAGPRAPHPRAAVRARARPRRPALRCRRAFRRRPDQRVRRSLDWRTYELVDRLLEHVRRGLLG